MSEASTTAARSRDPTSTLLLGTMLFLASELLLFAGLFAAYFSLRTGTSPWPPDGTELDTAIAATGTLVLMASSGTFQLGARAAERRDRRGLRRWLVVTFALGAAFLGVQAFDYSRLDFAVDTHAYGTMYLTMTGMHGLHVLAGLALITVLAFRTGPMVGRRDADAVHASGYYWHFVDAVWIGLFTVLFVVR